MASQTQLPGKTSFFCFLLCAFLNLSLTLPAQAKDMPTGKTLTPRDAVAKAQSKQLLGQQFKTVQARAQEQSGARIWYAGFGLDSGTGAFRGDVDLAESQLKAINTQILSYKLDNQVQTKELDRPFAHLGSIQSTIKHISQQVKDQDLAVILMTSHGNVGFIANQIGNLRYGNIMAHHINTVLRNLKETPTILIISACYSGSLIPTLEARNRIILTAASKDKSSWGCSPLDKNTFFIDALFGKEFNPTLSLNEIFEQTKARIAKREEEQKLTPSEPQIFVGENMRKLASQKFSDVIGPHRFTTGADATAAAKEAK